MIATSVAARGLDVKGLNLVVNYTVSTHEYPDMYRYIHIYIYRLNLVVNYTVSTHEYPDMYRYIHIYIYRLNLVVNYTVSTQEYPYPSIIRRQAEPRGEVHSEYSRVPREDSPTTSRPLAPRMCRLRPFALPPPDEPKGRECTPPAAQAPARGYAWVLTPGGTPSTL